MWCLRGSPSAGSHWFGQFAIRFILVFSRNLIYLIPIMPEQIQSDIEYWDDMRKGNQDSLSWLYNRYFKLLYNYGRKIGVETAALEDAIHDLFVDLWRYRGNVSSTTSVRFYLYRSLRRRVLRNDSGKNYFLVNGVIPENLLQSEPSLEQGIIENEIHDHRVNRLKKLLNDLSPRQYEAMTLRFYDELTFEEIAAILNVNEQSARNLIQRGLIQLKQYSKHLLALIPVLYDMLRC
jgi:RNA polymerase sigma factor (sigma-70 family)